MYNSFYCISLMMMMMMIIIIIIIIVVVVQSEPKHVTGSIT